MMLQPGQFFRNTDTLGCIRRIKEAKASDVDNLHTALLKEKLTKNPRRKLCRFLAKRINELDTDKI